MTPDPTAELVRAVDLARSDGVARDERRRLLADAIVHAPNHASESGQAIDTRVLLVQAHALRAEDARHGAGQLSLGAQRAPTQEACDDGWRRVAEIVEVAEISAHEAAAIAATLSNDVVPKGKRDTIQRAARRAQIAAAAARRLLEERNHAYTFHTDGGFSFGEGWYLAAAGVLAGVEIQIEPDRPATAAAETFLRACGLGPLLRPYRPRPRAMKHVTEIVGRAFRRDPLAAQRRLREAFLGGEDPSEPVRRFVDERLASVPKRPIVLLWLRHGAHHPGRNTDHDELVALTERVRRLGATPAWIGDAARGAIPPGVLDLIFFWKDPLFRGVDQRRAQLQFFEHLRRAHGLVGQLGVTTAGMDGPALMGLPTLYLTDAPNVRMRAWVDAVPGYREVVREAGWCGAVDAYLSGLVTSSPLSVGTR